MKFNAILAINYEDSAQEGYQALVAMANVYPAELAGLLESLVFNRNQ